MNYRTYKLIGIAVTLIVAGIGGWKHTHQGDNLWSGLSQQTSWNASNLEGKTELANAKELIRLDNLAYKVGYSQNLRNPIWVMYTLHNEHPNYSGKRPEVGFQADDRLPNPVTTEDYRNSGYDRGHMAPSYAIGKVWGPQAQLETFLLSNISPQKHDMNDGVWNSIERMEMDDFVKRFGKIKVVCGPIFSNPPKRLKSGVAVPESFFKAIQRPDKEVIAFIVPQNPESPKPETYLASIQQIKELTNIDIFPDAPNPEKARTKIW